MPRLRNTATGVVVNVRDGVTLAGYEPVKGSGSATTTTAATTGGDTPTPPKKRTTRAQK